jgi:hypothetical protein
MYGEIKFYKIVEYPKHRFICEKDDKFSIRNITNNQ